MLRTPELPGAHFRRADSPFGPVPSAGAGPTRLPVSRIRPRVVFNESASAAFSLARAELKCYSTKHLAPQIGPIKWGDRPRAVYRAGLIVPCPRGAG